MISAIVLTKNEERNIERCIKSISFCSEIIVIDDYSNDKTLDIAKRNRAKVIKHHLNNNFSSQRNYGITKAKGEWVLFIDADEVVPTDLKKEILSATKSNDNTLGFYIKRKDFVFGKEMKYGELSSSGGFGNSKILRLARKKAGRWDREVHEYWKIDGKTNELKNSILHYSHSDVKSFVSEINFFSTLHALSLRKEGKKSSYLKIIIWPIGKFIYNYFFRLGFLDGREGLFVAIMMSFHSFLAWSKLLWD